MEAKECGDLVVSKDSSDYAVGASRVVASSAIVSGTSVVFATVVAPVLGMSVDLECPDSSIDSSCTIPLHSVPTLTMVSVVVASNSYGCPVALVSMLASYNSVTTVVTSISFGSSGALAYVSVRGASSVGVA